MRKDVRNRSESALEAARRARRSPSVVEKIVWDRLRNDQTGFHFRREVPVGSFRLDFYCAEAKLGIEFDGEQHDALRDAERDQAIAGMGIEVFRFPNVEFFMLEGNSVTDHIQEIVRLCEHRTGRSAGDKPTRRSRR